MLAPPSAKRQRTEDSVTNGGASVVEHPLAFLNGIWLSSSTCKDTKLPLRWLLKDGVQWRDMEGGRIQHLKLEPVTGDFLTIKSEGSGRTFTASGVQKGGVELFWRDSDGKLFATWTKERTERAAAFETIAEHTEMAEHEFNAASASMQKFMLKHDEAKKDLEAMQRSMKGAEAAMSQLRAKQAPATHLAPQCKVCMDRPMGVVFVGCGHIACDECSKEAGMTVGKPCPFCKTPIAGVQKIFW